MADPGTEIETAFNRLADLLDHVARETPHVVDRQIERWAIAGLARLKLAASGRPGPRRVTGDYTRSMNVQFERHADGVTAILGTNDERGPRLEFGYHGVDSRGRRFSQPPYPHFRPTGEWMATGYVQELGPAIAASIPRSA